MTQHLTPGTGSLTVSAKQRLEDSRTGDGDRVSDLRSLPACNVVPSSSAARLCWDHKRLHEWSLSAREHRTATCWLISVNKSKRNNKLTCFNNEFKLKPNGRNETEVESSLKLSVFLSIPPPLSLWFTLRSNVGSYQVAADEKQLQSFRRRRFVLPHQRGSQRTCCVLVISTAEEFTFWMQTPPRLIFISTASLPALTVIPSS